MTPSELEQVQSSYQELKDLCKDMELDVSLIDMAIPKEEKETLKVLVPSEPKKSWWCFAI